MFVLNKVIGIAVSVGILFLPLAAPAGAAQFSPENNEILDGVFAGPVPLKPSAPLACPVIATNANTAQTFCSIQEANDAPTTLAGHTISVMAGTYTDQMSTITKSLTIIGNGAGVTLDGANATRVMTATSAAITLTLQNITMTHGNGNGSLSDGDGGCLLVNAANVNVALINVTFSSCAAAGTGGGASINGRASITASQFISNSAYAGGGAYVGDATIVASQFISNSAKQPGGGAYIDGSAFITASQFINNLAKGGSGGGAVIIGSATITASQFIGNSAGNNGGGTAILAVATITASQFVDNMAQGGGGAYLPFGRGSVANSLFARNTAASAIGDAIYSCYSAVSSCGSLNIAFTTIASPTQSGGAAVFVGSRPSATLNMTNTIIVNHAVGISNTGAVNENFNYFDGNGANIAGSGTTTSGANHPSGAQASVNPVGDDWRLAAGNPAINTGTDIGIYTDYFGAVRPSGSGFDIGYHEAAVGTVIVRKVVVGTPPTAPWAFNIPTGTVNLPAAGGSITLMGQVTGSYFVTETTQSGFVPTASCTNGASGTNGVTFDLAANAVITCTFTNTAFTPTPTATSTPTSTPTATPTNTPTPTATSTPTSTPTATPTNTPTPTATSALTNTPTQTPTSTSTPIETPTSTLTSTPTETPTPGASTAIELAGFYAETTSAAKCDNPSGAECVSVFWQTLREANTAGFVLLRGDAADGRVGAQEVSEFIQSEGASGANYAWQDTSTQAGHAYAYWLREIALDGSTREYGPVLVFVDGAVK
ncbi:MAG TPA: choice-of-anchor Q domain-containing protein [Thermoflexales bacterium]|nr:choice-of-anchor Q domain-containing protein [Thermoflexales bacterium]